MRTRKRILSGLLLLILALIAACSASEEAATAVPTEWVSAAPAQAADAGLAITIYNEGSALVRDQRQFEFARGINEVAFTDVASQMDPTSVLFKSLTDPTGTTVLEQNYVYDLVNTSALLEKYLDQPIRVVTTDGQVYEGTLLSGRDNIILQDGDGEVQVITSAATQQFSFPELPDGLITRPTLEWKLLADQAGEQDVEITYLTYGMTWAADYVLLLSEDSRSLDLDVGCPADPGAAEGTPCSIEGKTCGTCDPDPCRWCNLLHCQNGKWIRVEVYPDPNCACGALLTCAADEYCEKTHPGACGGTPVPPAGCPANCAATTCPGGQNVCVCTDYACHKLPAGCTSCACLASAGGCSCTSVGAGILIECFLP